MIFKITIIRNNKIKDAGSYDFIVISVFFALKPSSKLRTPNPSFIIRHIDEIQSSRLHPNEKTIRISLWSPVKTHFPAMQISGKTESRVSASFRLKVIAEVSDIYIPVFSYWNGATHINGVSCNSSGINAIDKISTNIEIVIDAEIGK